MNEALLQELLKLSPAERLELVHALWDTLTPADIPPLTQAQCDELDRRLEEHRRNPGSALPWEEVRARLRARFR